MKKGRGWILGYSLTIFCALALVHWGNAAVTTVSEQLPVPRQHCIIIDAGHGGVDGGASSCTGKLESAYNLEISLKLRDLLHFLGFETKMIRTRDESIYIKGNTIGEKKISDLKERVRIVNETGAGLLISIHQNQYPDSRYSGPQVFYASTPGSQKLAWMLQEKLTSVLKPSVKRKEKESKGVYLMKHIQKTGVLIECGFLSNPTEEAFLSSPIYQKRLCCIIGSVLCQFLG